MEKIRLGFASDHRGYDLKEQLLKNFKKQEDILDITDCGTDSSASVDYPDFAYLLGREIQANNIDFGIAICGSGIGISIALNKMKGVYCAKVNNALEARYTRLDNNTNCVSFSGDTKLDDAIMIVDTFIHTEFSKEERHQRRIDKIKRIEDKLYG